MRVAYVDLFDFGFETLQLGYSLNLSLMPNIDASNPRLKSLVHPLKPSDESWIQASVNSVSTAVVVQLTDTIDRNSLVLEEWVH